MEFVVPTTPTQYALGLCFLIAGPSFALLAAMIQWRRRENLAFGALATLVASWCGWFVSCVVALVLFRGYPVSGSPPEPVAMLFTAPGLLLGGLVLSWLATRRAPTRGTTEGLRVAAAALGALALASSVTLVVFHRFLTVPAARRALPWSAEILREEHYRDSFIGDVHYDLEVRIERDEFDRWTRDLGLEPTADPARFERPGSDPTRCTAFATQREGVGRFTAWCM